VSEQAKNDDNDGIYCPAKREFEYAIAKDRIIGLFSG